MLHAGQPPCVTSSEASADKKAFVAEGNGALSSPAQRVANPCCSNKHLLSIVFTRCTFRHVHVVPSGCTPSAHSPLTGRDHHSPTMFASTHCPALGAPPARPCNQYASSYNRARNVSITKHVVEKRSEEERKELTRLLLRVLPTYESYLPTRPTYLRVQLVTQ